MQLEIYTGLVQSALSGKNNKSSYYSFQHPALAVNNVIKNALSYSQRTTGTQSTDELTSSHDGRLSNESVLSNTENEKPTIVSFKDSVSVVLVPTRDEYIKHRLFDSLWYNCSDYSVFTADAMREVDSYISTNDSDLKAALTGLYQSKGESNPLKLSNINSSNSISVSVSSSSSASNNNLNNIPDDEYGNFVDFDNLPIRMIMSTQSSFALEDEPQFVLDL